MRGGFRVWMTGTGILVVELTVASMLLYALPVAEERLESHDLNRLTARATQTADAIAEGGGRDPRRSLDLAADPDGGEAVFVGRAGRVVARAGSELLGLEPGILRETAAGDRVSGKVGGGG